MENRRTARYCRLCDECQHPLSSHFLVHPHETIDGPYVCQYCACQVGRYAPGTWIGRLEYVLRFEPDGSLEVPCSYCGAAAGEFCRTRTNQAAPVCHAARQALVTRSSRRA